MTTLSFKILFPAEFALFAVVLFIIVAMLAIWVYKFIKSLIPGLGD
jgi:hypothetical protein